MIKNIERMIYLQDWWKRSKAFLVVVTFLLAFTPVTTFASSTQPENELTYIGIGDSLAEGLLESGGFSDTEGYFGHIKNALTSKGYKINAENYAKSGADSADVLAQVENISRHPNGADILTISVGANDILPYLAPLSNSEFQEAIGQAQMTLQQFQVSVNKSEGTFIDTQTTFNQLLTDLINIQNFVEDTITNFTVDPIFQQLPNADDQLATMAAFVAAIKNNINEIESVVKDMTLPAELNEGSLHQVLPELLSTLKLMNDNLSIMKISMEEVSDIVNEIQLPPEFENDYGTIIQQAYSNLGTVKESISNTQTQLIKLTEDVQDLAFLLEEVPASQKTIVDSLHTIEDAFTNAYGELEIIGNNIYSTIEKAKAINPGVDIYILGYYNALPYLSEGFQEQTIPLLTSLNGLIEKTASVAGATYVPSFKAFDGKHLELLPNPNDIHPNEAGYLVLAEQFIHALNDTYPPIPEVDENKVKPIIKEPIEQETPKKKKVDSEKIDKDKIITVEDGNEASKEVVKKEAKLLPKTATNHYNALLIGSVLIGLAISSQILHKRRQNVR